MKAGFRLVAALMGASSLALGAMVAFSEKTPAETEPRPAAGEIAETVPNGPHTEAPPRVWAPPTWFPAQTRDDLWVLSSLDGTAAHKWGPKVKAYAGILADLDSGEVLWARDADAPRSIASVTKLVSTLALVSSDVDLDRPVCIGLEQWPTRPGARSKFETGECYAGWDYLGAALVASDNRGAFALPAVAQEDYYVFVDRMGQVADDLGLRAASFADPAGLEDENMASARDVLKAVTAVSLHPELSLVASAPSWRIETSRGPRALGSTNRLLALAGLPAKRRFEPPPYETLAGKTGYTDTAHYCFATVVRSLVTGRRYGAVVLSSPTSSARFDDVLSMLRWADARR
jgi:D-alanyl-D-alanine endopeptidase (penicillin-binding protein 7)